MLTCESCIHFEPCNSRNLIEAYETEAETVMTHCSFFIDRKLCIIFTGNFDNEPKNIEAAVKSILEYGKSLRGRQSDE